MSNYGVCPACDYEESIEIKEARLIVRDAFPVRKCLDCSVFWFIDELARPIYWGKQR